MIGIDIEKSKIVLIGNSKFPDDEINFPPIDGATGNIDELHKLFMNNSILGVSEKNVVKLFNQPENIIRFQLSKASKEADDTLLVYYIGHGVREDGQLYLTAYNSIKDYIGETAIDIVLFKNIIKKSNALKRILILDCCYSGLAISGELGNADSELEAQISDITGTYILSSSPSNKVSMQLEGDEYTLFTGELIKALKFGIPNKKAEISLDDIYEHINKEFKTKQSKFNINISPPIRSNQFQNKTDFGFAKNIQFVEYLKLMEQATKMFNQNDYFGSSKKFKEAFNLFPDHKYTIENKYKPEFCQVAIQGEQAKNNDDFVAAFELFQRALKYYDNEHIRAALSEVKKKHIDLLENRAQIYFKEKNYEDAALLFNQLIQLEPENNAYIAFVKDCELQINIKTLRHQADYHYYHQNYEKALSLFKEYSKLHNDLLIEEKIRNCEKELTKQEDILWFLASEHDIYSLYSCYLKRYPDGKYKDEVIQRAQNNENAAWQIAAKENTIQSYYHFNMQFPNSIYKETVNEKINQVVPLPEKDEILEIWNLITKINTIDSYNYFIEKYIDNEFSEIAWSKLIELEEINKSIIIESSIKTSGFDISNYMDNIIGKIVRKSGYKEILELLLLTFPDTIHKDIINDKLGIMRKTNVIIPPKIKGEIEIPKIDDIPLSVLRGKKKDTF